MSRYIVHPLEQSFQNWDHNYKKRRNEYWSKLRLAKSDYQMYVNPHNDPDEFKQWMLSNWGIKMGVDNDGNFIHDYRIIDEKKYMLFMLKYA